MMQKMPVKMRRKSRIIQVVPIRTLEDSPEQLDRRLVSAYLLTNYKVPALDFQLRINQPDAALDKWLERGNYTHFAIITAWNPGSQWRPETANRANNRLLEAKLRAAAQVVLPALGQGDQGDWPAEESFFAAGIRQDEALHLAADFSQNALVFGTKGHPPELFWLI